MTVYILSSVNLFYKYKVNSKFIVISQTNLSPNRPTEIGTRNGDVNTSE